MTQPQQSALAMLQSLLHEWGLDSLSTTVRDMLTAGDPAEVIPIKLRETQQYKTRFAGNVERMKRGLPVLSEAEYLATEQQLRNQVRRYVGSGVYDTKDNLDKWMSADVSPQELNDRLGLYQSRYLQQPQSVRDAWSNLGYTPADAIKVMMDPGVDETKLRRQADVYSLGGAAYESYGKIPSISRLAELVDRGADVDKARQQFSEVAARADREGFLARSANRQLTIADQEDAALLNNQEAERRRAQVLDEERARFAQGFLGGQQSVARNTSGSY